MNDKELCRQLDQAVLNAATSDHNYLDVIEDVAARVNGELYGDEEDGRSQIITSEVSDTIESDMPSLARVFLGAGDIVEFQPVNEGDPRDVQEAEDKNALIPHVIRTSEDWFRTHYDWLKTSEMAPIAMLEYGWEESEESQYIEYTGLDLDELTQIITQHEEKDEVQEVEIVSKDVIGDRETAKYNVEIKLIKTCKKYFQRNTPPEDIICSKNAWNKRDADLVGKAWRKTRGQLVAEGFGKDQVSKLTRAGTTETSNAKDIRLRKQGGFDGTDTFDEIASEEVEGVDVYCRLDYDGDGIAELLHVIKSGDEILMQDNAEHIPYALISSMLMPNTIIGRSRGEIVLQDQRQKTFLMRGINDNIAAVNKPRTYVNEDQFDDLDELADHRIGGILYGKGSAQTAIQPVVTPYIGDKALQVVQAWDAIRAYKTGNMIENQALSADDINEETATKTKRLDEAGKGKIELVARVIAEVGYKDLYEGFAWMLKHYQDTEMEMSVLGRQMAVNPSKWRYNHSCRAVVGTGAGDDAQTLQTMMGVFQLQTQLIQEGSPLADESKRYNTLARMTKAAGQHNIPAYFNNPEQPQQLLMAEVERLTRENQTMQQQMQNPLAEAEQIRAQAKLVSEQQRQQFEMQKIMFEWMKKDQHKQADMTTDFTKMEIENGVDIPGAGTEDAAIQNDGLGQR